MKTKVLASIVLGALLLAACSTSPAAQATSAPTADSNAAATVTVPSTDQSSQSGSNTTAAAVEVSFSKDIWPVIQQFALPAHGTEMKGGVSLASYEDIMKYVVPGDPAASELYKRLTGDGVPVMPPSGKLPDATIQLFYDWIAQGAQNN